MLIPYQDAIHVARWVSLLTLQILWLFLWIWATIYCSDRGWGFEQGDASAKFVVSELINTVKGLECPVDLTVKNTEK